MELDERQTLIIAILVLALGKFLNKNVSFFREYNIPEPVTGGVLASFVFAVIYFTTGFNFEFYLQSRDAYLIIFFTSIGLSASFKELLKGGKPLVILLVLAVVYLFIQNLTGIAVALASGMSAKVGIIGGSVSLSGGHGTAIAWAPTFINEYGISGAMELGLACATFGLVLGGVIGGPIAKYLVNKYNLEPDTTSEKVTVGVSHENEEKATIDYDRMMRVILVLCVAIGLGTELNDLFGNWGLDLPDFVTCLFAGIILTNTVPYLFPKLPWAVGATSLSLVAEISLGLFLAMSLMSLQLWALVDLAGPILFILLAQLIVILLYTIFVVFRVMGKNYDAAVMASGYAGLGLGATPTAIANMTAVTQRFGASPLSFIVIPLVGAFFIDISNAIIIKLLLSWV